VEIESPTSAVLPVVKGRESEPFKRLGEIAELGMAATGVEELRLDLPELIDTVARQLGRQLAEEIEGDSPSDVLRSLSSYYQTHAMGRLTVVRDRPLTLRVSQCFACTSQSPEIGRVLCSEMLRTVLESRIGPGWEVSKPDPRKHAQCGCVFKVSVA
jgi:predicted hydrocarbon binding protein